MTSGSFGSCPSLKRVIQIHLFVILSPTYHKRKESHAMETVQAGLFPPSLLPSGLRAPSCLPRYHNSDLKRLHRIVLCSLKNRKLCLNSFVKFGLSFRTRQCAVTLEVKLAKDPSQVVRAYSLRLQSTVCLGPELYVAEHLLFSDSVSTRLWYRFLTPLNSIKHGNLSLLLPTASNVILPSLVLECFVP